MQGEERWDWVESDAVVQCGGEEGRDRPGRSRRLHTLAGWSPHHLWPAL